MKFIIDLLNIEYPAWGLISYVRDIKCSAREFIIALCDVKYPACRIHIAVRDSYVSMSGQLSSWFDSDVSMGGEAVAWYEGYESVWGIAFDQSFGE